ncbi:hypothetical protein HHL22_08145 [Hymenobacter sp. RP-2-7]|uniref:Uncharacterized protein n=1 Tax=Hymenobacter polaris TaxID=2682546 RepID=A0A7Y0FLU2_9BACT|nr:hypothetical protein [Hymenobacter polaris]NML65172.1 hypothetical protein [Hymenobacter polaris]
MPIIAKKPRISVNKLAEYLEASPTRRKKIISDAKNPAKFITTRYTNARDVIKNYLIAGQDEDYVLESIKEIEEIEAKSDFQEQDKALSIESLELLLETDFAVLDECEIINFDDANKLIEIAGVNISVNPDLVLTKRVGDITHIGAVKLHLSKSNLLTNESQKIVGVMLHDFTGKFLTKEGENPNPKLSMSIDVFQATIDCCPKSYTLRMRTIETACEEIALWWGKL